MVQAQLFAAWFGIQFLAVRSRVRGPDSERGDVPGWVMVTVMTAGLWLSSSVSSRARSPVRSAMRSIR